MLLLLAGGSTVGIIGIIIFSRIASVQIEADSESGYEPKSRVAVRSSHEDMLPI